MTNRSNKVIKENSFLKNIIIKGNNPIFVRLITTY